MIRKDNILSSILEAVTPKYYIIIHHELVLAFFLLMLTDHFLLISIIFNFNHQHATKLPMLIQLVYIYRRENKMRKIKTKLIEGLRNG